MTPQQLIGIGVRLFALWLGLSSIAFLTAVPSDLSAVPPGFDNSVALSYAIGAAYVASALLLWFFPMLVAHKLLPRTQYANLLTFQAHELARVGCSLVGLWLFAKAVQSLVWFLFRSFVMVDAGSSFSALPLATKVEIGVALFEVFLALMLILKSHVFATLVVPTPSPPKPDTDGN
jgi:hypothetical protein